MNTSYDEETYVNAVRCLAAALPQTANSGHPGAPMGLAPIAHTLFTKIMNYSPNNPLWISRDRFILSNGHACALLYTMLHLTGYNMSIDDLKKFRQLGGVTPGHPELNQEIGIEVTTGPLGQGLCNAVGLALANKMMMERYNVNGEQIINSYIYSICGEGCLQEGITSEASSLAGHLGLGRLIVLFDCNNITIDGGVNLSYSEDVEKRYLSYGWQVLHVHNADQDLKSIEKTIQEAQKVQDKPTLIICKTTIGYGSKNQGTEKVHGAPLGAQELEQYREKCKFSPANDFFHFDDKIIGYYKNIGKIQDKKYTAWKNHLDNVYKKKNNQLYEELLHRSSKDNSRITDLQPLLNAVSPISPNSTRALSGQILNIFVQKYLQIVGGSGDLTSSNCTALKDIKSFTKENASGRYIHYGVREHGMMAITNGIQAYGGFKPFCATFLNFITYGWGAVRLSALSHLPVLYIMTHDSIELGEDGPTHQPIEVAALCRATPNLHFYRPADKYEILAAYVAWMNSEKTPIVLALNRSTKYTYDGTSTEKAMQYGAYITSDFDGNSAHHKVILAGSGTELQLCQEAKTKLSNQYNIRIVSMPCWDVFEEQSDSYKESILPKNIPKIYIEAANVIQYKNYFDHCIHMTTFGASGKSSDLHNHFGFNIQNITKVMQSLVG